VDLRVFVILVDQLQELLFTQVGGLIVLNRVKAQFMSGLLFPPDIALGSRVFTHQNRYKSGDHSMLGLQPFHFGLQFGPDFFGHLGPFDQFGWHRRCSFQKREKVCPASPEILPRKSP